MANVFTNAYHRQRCEEAYLKYLKVQAAIERFEKAIGERFKGNDREAEAYMKEADDPGVWRYKQWCKLREVYQSVIAVEKNMAGLYS